MNELVILGIAAVVALALIGFQAWCEFQEAATKEKEQMRQHVAKKCPKDKK